MSSYKFLLRSVQTITIAIVAFIVLILCTIEHYRSATGSLPADCALVFGAVVHGEAQVSPAIDRRVRAVAELFHADKVRSIVMTGGKGRKAQQSEAQVMKRLAIRLGVPASAVHVEKQATSTWENIALSMPMLQLLQCKHTVAVSDDYHIARILYTARLQRLPLTAYAVQTHVPLPIYKAHVLREVAAFIGYTVLVPIRGL